MHAAAWARRDAPRRPAPRQGVRHPLLGAHRPVRPAARGARRARRRPPSAPPDTPRVGAQPRVPAPATKRPGCSFACHRCANLTNARYIVHGRDPHQRRCGHARRQPQHAALMGAALRLPRAAPHGRRPPAVRPRRDRGAALGLRGDPQHLLRRRPGARARRRAGHAVAPAQRVRALRRGRRRPRPRGEPGRALGRAHRRGGAAPRRREPRPRRRGRQPRVRLRVALGDRLARRRDPRRAPGHARRTACSSSMPALRATWTPCTPRRSSCACAVAACAR